jgi:hypothetical protein
VRPIARIKPYHRIASLNSAASTAISSQVRDDRDTSCLDESARLCGLFGSNEKGNISANNTGQLVQQGARRENQPIRLPVIAAVLFVFEFVFRIDTGARLAPMRHTFAAAERSRHERLSRRVGIAPRRPASDLFA